MYQNDNVDNLRARWNERCLVPEAEAKNDSSKRFDGNKLLSD